MFEPSDAPRVFATALGVDFSAALIDGIDARLAGQSPEALARVEVIVNSDRMRRRLVALYAERKASFLPRITPIARISERRELAGLPPAVTPLRLRLEIARLVGALLDAEPGLAPRSAIYDLADSLAELMAEMHEEGVGPGALAALEMGDFAEHWRRNRRFVEIVAGYFDAGASGPLAPEARAALAIGRLVEVWAARPPAHPVIVAGSTGSRGSTARLMAAVAALPQGAVVLPGIDRDIPGEVWRGLLEGRRGEGLAGEDHPQFRLASFAERMGLEPGAIPAWSGAEPVAPARNRWLSLALRPAPVTDAWLSEGPELLREADPVAAFADVTLIEAQSPRAEAGAIALRLRKAAEEGQRAVLVTPDRGLVRQVTAALDRWGIVPDDSAGLQLDLSPPGRLLALAADLMAGRGDAAELLSVLKHPLTNSGTDRGPHLRRTRELELKVLRGGGLHPDPAAIRAWAGEIGEEGAGDWAEWVIGAVLGAAARGRMALGDLVAAHVELAEALAAGPGAEGAGALWAGEAGQAAMARMRAVAADAEAGGEMSAADYRDLIVAIMADADLRNPARPHAGVMIWGAMEARVQGADLMILGGLAEGTWPAAERADPWLNRALRAAAGLRLPDRRTGLSAHDFQQAAAAREVWLSRALRDAETETVPARWLNRLVNLLDGSGEASAAALAAMKARGAEWLAMAEALDAPTVREKPAPRPAPAPPAEARPRQLSVTQIETLVRDPYAIYARKVLGLKPLDPLRPAPDARLRGEILHRIVHRFVSETPGALPDAAEALLVGIAAEELARAHEWPVARHLWQAAIAKAAPAFVAGERRRREIGEVFGLETWGEAAFELPAVRLTGKADRIDLMPDGRFALYDYKSGSVPTEKQEREFNQQLRLEAVMAAHGAFGEARQTALAAYVGLTAAGKEYAVELTPGDVAETEARLMGLWSAFLDEGHGFMSRRAMAKLTYASDYEHLARYGEWDEADAAVVIEVGR